MPRQTNFPPSSEDEIVSRGVTYNIKRHPKFARHALMRAAGRPKVANRDLDAGRLHKQLHYNANDIVRRWMGTP